MEWIIINKSDFSPIEVINTHTGRSRVYFNPIEFEEDNVAKIKCLYKDFDYNYNTFLFKHALIQLQEEYDKSDEVNCFLFNGQKAWLDKETRVGLVNSCDVRERKGYNDYSVYFNGKEVTLPITLIRNILDDVEEYAMECYGVTERHLAEINALSSRVAILNYNITADYPQRLEFNYNSNNSEEA